MRQPQNQTDSINPNGEVIPAVAVDGDLSYFHILDAVSAPILLHRLGRVIYVNASWERLSGYSRDEMYGWGFYEIGRGEWAETLRQRAEARMRGEDVLNVYEFPLKTKDDRDCWVEISAYRLMLGETPTIFCSFYDLTDRKRSEAAQQAMRKMLAQIIDGSPIPTFVIDVERRVTHWNRACTLLTGVAPDEMIGTRDVWKIFYETQRSILADLIVEPGLGDPVALYGNKIKASGLLHGAYEIEDFFPGLGAEGTWIYFTAAPLRDVDGKIWGAVETLVDVTERRRAEEQMRDYQTQLEAQVSKRTEELAEANSMLEADIISRRVTEHRLKERNEQLVALNQKLEEATKQFVQSEKLASIGQLAAGVAHEINNPIGYVHSNIGSLEKYLADLFEIFEQYGEILPKLEAADQARLRALQTAYDLDFLKEDIPVLMRESKEGITRVKKIVQDLKDFSRIDTSDEWVFANLHEGLNSTINIVNNEIKYRADVIKEYGDIPEIQCLPSQLNQVFMNLLVNAAHAMGEERGRIVIRTGATEDEVWLSFADTGCGMSEEVKSKIFDPFFTTKPIGKGTGLGLSLSYGIIQNHHGRLEVESAPGQGTTFRVTLPIRHEERLDVEDGERGE